MVKQILNKNGEEIVFKGQNLMEGCYMNNFMELQEWRNTIGKLLANAGYGDTKRCLECYMRRYFKTLYESKRGQYDKIEYLSWQQIAELYGDKVFKNCMWLAK